MRYRHLLQKAIDDGTPLRELARAMKLPPASIHNYLTMDTEPRLDALRKMSAYFSEPVSILIGEDDDLTAQLLTVVRKLPRGDKKRLLATLTDSDTKTC